MANFKKNHVQRLETVLGYVMLSQYINDSSSIEHGFQYNCIKDISEILEVLFMYFLGLACSPLGLGFKSANIFGVGIKSYQQSIKHQG